MVRVSEYESVDTALQMPARPDWVWLDSFTGALPPRDDLARIAEAGLKVMLVSPELQARQPEAEVDSLRTRLADAGLTLVAVCTKRPDLWAD